MTELFIALFAGLISFLSPCVLPLIPGYLAYITGASFNDLLEKRDISLLPIASFALGFSIIFIIFGMAATFMGQLLLKNSNELRIIAGSIIIIFSLQVIGILKLDFLNFEKKYHPKSNKGLFGSLIMGMAFAFGWTPCIGPILGSILILASTEESINRGILLLIFYSLGLAIPFILSGYLFQKFIIVSKNLKKRMNLITKFGGSLLLITGILIITNQLQALGFYILEYLPILSKIG